MRIIWKNVGLWALFVFALRIYVEVQDASFWPMILGVAFLYIIVACIYQAGHSRGRAGKSEDFFFESDED